MKVKRGGRMSFDMMDKRRLSEIEENTSQTVKELRLLNSKMDKQIKLLEKMVEVLERSTDADY